MSVPLIRGFCVKNVIRFPDSSRIILEAVSDDDKKVTGNSFYSFRELSSMHMSAPLKLFPNTCLVLGPGDAETIP